MGVRLQSFGRLATGLAWMALWSQAGCGGSSPAAPTTADPVALQGTASVRSVSGTVRDVIDGSALGGVTVAIDRSGSASTDGGGQFVVPSSAANGRYDTTLSGPHVVTRQTTVTIPSPALALTLIPASFDMASFEEFARGLASGFTIRWTSAPALIVETSLVASPSEENVALADRIPSAEVDRVVERLSGALPLLTGSAFATFASVTRRTTPAGSPARMFNPGAITVVYYTESNGACGQASPRFTIGTSQVIAAAVWLKLGCASLSRNTTVLVHELGHALGYGHVTVRPSVMGPTAGMDLTGFDMAAAAIVYRRPPGSRAPDTDPSPSRSTAALGLGDGVVTVPPLP
jgi:hypothetical protein